MYWKCVRLYERNEVFSHCNAAMMNVLHWFGLQQHVEKRLFVRMVLRGDLNIIFPDFSKLLRYVTLDADVVPDS